MTDTGQLARELEALLAKVPQSQEPQAPAPLERASEISKSATLRTAAISSGLAMPRGAAGILAILPDLLSVWHIQSVMVADIAACYGKTHDLDSTKMAYCLFHHVDDKILWCEYPPLGKHSSTAECGHMFSKLARSLSVRIGQRLLGRVLGSWAPFLGALGLGALTAYDTDQVARTARRVFG